VGPTGDGEVNAEALEDLGDAQEEVVAQPHRGEPLLPQRPAYSAASSFCQQSLKAVRRMQASSAKFESAFVIFKLQALKPWATSTRIWIVSTCTALPVVVVAHHLHVAPQVEIVSKTRKLNIVLSFQALNSRHFRPGFHRFNMHRLVPGAINLDFMGLTCTTYFQALSSWITWVQAAPPHLEHRAPGEGVDARERAARRQADPPQHVGARRASQERLDTLLDVAEQVEIATKT
jgi:hypothetical protein